MKSKRVCVALILIANCFLIIICTKNTTFPETVEKGASLELVYQQDECIFEGPVWNNRDQCLLFTSTNQCLFRLSDDGSVQQILEKTGGMMGLCPLPSGEIIGGRIASHSILKFQLDHNRLEPVQIMATVPDLHQPNDLCYMDDGTIFFSDPDFEDRCDGGVYRLSADGQVQKVIDDMIIPNGIAISNDQKVLYVGDTLEKVWRSYNISNDGSLSNASIFFQPHERDEARIKNRKIDWGGSPDGIAVDQYDNLYLTDKGGVWVVDKEGQALGFIGVPDVCTNVTFGGKNGNYLFITCHFKVYKLKMCVKGSNYCRTHIES